ncbi:Uncharacterized protein APZ42_002983, partial [Daphnia magna]
STSQNAQAPVSVV